MTDLAAIRDGWDQAAHDDAMFNILTLPGMAGNWNPDQFFAHGVAEIEDVLDRLDGLGLWPERRRYALDFGCGVGRLAQALAEYYETVDGVDISEEMINQAEDYAHHYGRKNCRYFVNDRDHLQLFTSGRYDLIYTVITLQHMPQELQRGYVEEFIRLLHPKGVAMFQIPEGPVYHHPDAWLSMYGTPLNTVRNWIKEAGGEVADIELTNHSGGGWAGWRYTARRAA